MLLEYNRLVNRLKKLESMRYLYYGELQEYVEDEIIHIKGKINKLEKLILERNQESDFDIALMILNNEI